MLTIAGKPIIITNHAVKRMQERFRLRFHESNWESPEKTKALIYRELSRAFICVKWKQVPFYTNMVAWKYKLPHEVYKCGSVFYIFQLKETRAMLTTVVNKWWCE